MNETIEGFRIVKEKRGDTEVVTLVREDGAEGGEGSESKKTLVKKLKKTST